MKGVWSLIKFARQALEDGDYAAVKEYLDKINAGFHAELRERQKVHREKVRRREIYSPTKRDD